MNTRQRGGVGHQLTEIAFLSTHQCRNSSTLEDKYRNTGKIVVRPCPRFQGLSRIVSLSRPHLSTVSCFSCIRYPVDYGESFSPVEYHRQHEDDNEANAEAAEHRGERVAGLDERSHSAASERLEGD